MKKTRNSEVLKSFVEYCKEWPELRFWQALRNWSGYAFIYASDGMVGQEGTADTFYWEGKHKHDCECKECKKK